MELVRDEDAPLPDKSVEANNDLGRLANLVNRLDGRESAIIKSRYGLDGGTEQTLEEVGADLGVTRERIRQLQNSALLKLRKMIDEADPEESGAPSQAVRFSNTRCGPS